MIIDANISHKFFRSPVDPDFVPVWKWISDKDGMLVVDKALMDELCHCHEITKRLANLKRNHRLIEVEDAAIQAERKHLAKKKLHSNDAHIIALARASRARVLCSEDANLHKDFKNRELVPKPPGRVYRRANKHEHLLKHHSTCPR